jgi:MFS family permease
MTHRSSHYFVWFLVFGVVAALAPVVGSATHRPDAESLWLLGSGLAGLVVGSQHLAQAKLARPYDILVGMLFAGVGVLGILDRFGVHALADAHLNTGLVTGAAILGLSLAFFPALIHTVLGLQSLNHGLKLSK